LTQTQNLQTIALVAERPISGTGRDALLVHIYPTGAGMGRRYNLADKPRTIGRDGDCDICIQDGSVSRCHARVEADGLGARVTDLGSTNGTFINNVPVSRGELKDGDYLRAGNCIFRFLAGGNIEAEYHEEIYRLTIIDALTGIHNKRYMLEFLDRELARSARHARPLALILFDIDHFKAVNDDLGHLAGDCILRELAGCVVGTVRKGELFARYGGEEFAVVLPEAHRESGIAFAERVRGLVQAHHFLYDGQPCPITVSLGVAVTAGEAPLTPEQLIHKADERLYQAKNAGRNCVAS
jgi:diguanylate cyclase (GGDEF)-like protein